MFRIILAIIILVSIVVLLFQGQYLLAAVASVLFTYLYGSIFLIGVGIGVDAYLGAFVAVPYFSFGYLLWYVIAELLQFKLRIMKKAWVN